MIDLHFIDKDSIDEAIKQEAGDELSTKDEPESQNEIKPDPEDLKPDPEDDVKPDPSLLSHLQRVVMMQQQQLLQAKQNQVMLLIRVSDPFYSGTAPDPT